MAEEDAPNGSKRSNSAIILLIDMDAFEWQVEVIDALKNHNLDLRGQCGVVVNPPAKIVAVSPEAKAKFNISRDMSLHMAKSLCPNLYVCMKNMKYGKPDSSKARSASHKIGSAVLAQTKTMKKVIVEFASKDEFYLDVTQEVNKRIRQGRELYKEVHKINGKFLLESRKRFRMDGILFRINKIHPIQPNRMAYQDEIRLLYGSVIAYEMMNRIHDETKFHCSIGVSHNKLLAKLGCESNKPEAITIFHPAGIDRVSKRIKITDIPGLGGNEYGGRLKSIFQLKWMSDLRKLSEKELNKHFAYENVVKFRLLGMGISLETVQNQQESNTLNCGKSYPRGIDDWDDIYRWFGKDFLCGELAERLEEEIQYNRRWPVSIKLSINTKSMSAEVNQFNGNLPIISQVEPLVFILLNEWKKELPVINVFLPIKEIKIFIPKFKNLDTGHEDSDEE